MSLTRKIPLAYVLVLATMCVVFQADGMAQVCQAEEVKTVTWGPHYARMGRFVRQNRCTDILSVYNPPPCWIIENHQLDILDRNNNVSHTTDFLAPNSSFLSAEEILREFEWAFSVTADIDVGQTQAEVEAALESMQKDLVEKSNQLSASHQSIQLDLKACGNGRLSPARSWIEAEVDIELRCVGCEIWDDLHLRAALAEVIEEIKEKRRLEPTLDPSSLSDVVNVAFRRAASRDPADNLRWTPWLNRDTPTGTGDFESLRAFLTEQPDVVCETPLEIQCRLPGSEELVPTGLLENGQRYVCDRRRGGICDNRTQDEGVTCSDYEVRFACLP